VSLPTCTNRLSARLGGRGGGAPFALFVAFCDIEDLLLAHRAKSGDINRFGRRLAKRPRRPYVTANRPRTYH
jgi:hypothetical protein